MCTAVPSFLHGYQESKQQSPVFTESSPQLPKCSFYSPTLLLFSALSFNHTHLASQEVQASEMFPATPSHLFRWKL